jgi:RHS repeat-associated protein
MLKNRQISHICRKKHKSRVKAGGTYDPVGRITAFTQSGTATVSTPVSSITYTYDANGNRQTSVQTTTTLAKTGGTTAVPILTPSTLTTTRNYQIDPTGNKLLGFSQTMAQTGGATSTANVAYSYDANGSLLTDGLRHYAYDSEGRLAAASLGWASSATTDDSITKYAHNAQAQRVFKTAPLFAVTIPDPAAPQSTLDAFTAFFESLWNPSTNPDGTTVQKAGMSYVYDEDGTLIADTLTGGAQTSWGQSARYIYLPTASGPMPVAAIYGTKHYAIQSDHLNTPRRLIQSDGQVAWQWSYSAFGDEQPTVAKNRFANVALNQSFGSTTVSAVTFNLRYPGQYFDQESNLHYNLNRSYCPGCGRYTQADPIDLQGGWNRFSYVGQNPLSFTDPLGLQALPSPWGPIPFPPPPVSRPRQAANDEHFGGGGGCPPECETLKKALDIQYSAHTRLLLSPYGSAPAKLGLKLALEVAIKAYELLCGPYSRPSFPKEPPKNDIDDFYSR